MAVTKHERRLGLLQATSINMTDMVGIGPFITMPMVIGIMNGPYFLYAWLAGGLLSFVDAMVWSELGAAFPMAGGSYNFLKATYGENKWGRLLSFLFVWQTMIQAPLVIASAAIGFSAYFSYLYPLSTLQAKLMSGGVVVSIVALLYRKIEAIGKISVVLWAAVLLTLLWIIAGGIAHGMIPEVSSRPAMRVIHRRPRQVVVHGWVFKGRQSRSVSRVPRVSEIIGIDNLQ